MYYTLEDFECNKTGVLSSREPNDGQAPSQQLLPALGDSPDLQ